MWVYKKYTRVQDYRNNVWVEVHVYMCEAKGFLNKMI